MGTFRSWGRPSYRTYGSGGGGFGWALTPVVKKLLLLNAGIFVGLFLLRIFSPASEIIALRELGVVPQETVFGFRVWQPLTYIFVHREFGHLFWNMLGLWMFGSALERDWGGRRFLRYYLLTGVGAGLLNVAVSLLWGGPAATVPTIGASGSVLGVLLAFGVLYPNAPILIMFVLPVPARIVVIVYGALTVLMVMKGPGSGISHISHLGGMLIGLGYLRGGGLFRGIRRSFAEWQLRRRRREFDVYLRDQDNRSRDLPRPDRWVN